MRHVLKLSSWRLRLALVTMRVCVVRTACLWAYKPCTLNPKPTHWCWVPLLTCLELLQSEHTLQNSADDENWELFKADDFRMYCMKVPTPAHLSSALRVMADRLGRGSSAYDCLALHHLGRLVPGACPLSA